MQVVQILSFSMYEDYEDDQSTNLNTWDKTVDEHLLESNIFKFKTVKKTLQFSAAPRQGRRERIHC